MNNSNQENNSDQINNLENIKNLSFLKTTDITINDTIKKLNSDEKINIIMNNYNNLIKKLNDIINKLS